MISLSRGIAGVFAWFLVAGSCFGNLEAQTAAAHTYASGFSVALKLGTELQEALPEKFATQLYSQPIILQPDDFPVVTPVESVLDNRPQRQVCMSAGLIDLVNHLCHAKAVDRVRPGFFDRYVTNLASLGGTNSTPPDIVDPRYWTDEIINDQMSYFNQMIGLLMAINLSHQYLGHYEKYAARMTGPGSQLLPINTFLTTAEWKVSFRAAAVNSLNCALATDGPRALFEALDKMPKRPAWADYIVPPDANLKLLNRELADWEVDFFHGRFK